MYLNWTNKPYYSFTVDYCYDFNLGWIIMSTKKIPQVQENLENAKEREPTPLDFGNWVKFDLSVLENCLKCKILWSFNKIFWINVKKDKFLFYLWKF